MLRSSSCRRLRKEGKIQMSTLLPRRSLERKLTFMSGPAFRPHTTEKRLQVADTEEDESLGKETQTSNDVIPPIKRERL